MASQTFSCSLGCIHMSLEQMQLIGPSFCESIELCAVARLARGSPAPPGPSPRVDVVSIGTALFTRRRVSGAQAPGRDRQACGIKAIRWAYRTLQVDCLMVSLGLVISSFQKTNSGERRESLPFSLYALMRFERRILMRECLDHEVVILGMFLLLAFSCLRSSDMQRTNPSSLRWDGAVLRGTCWRTKTCRTGQPFGLIGSGFLSKGTFTWLFKFLMVLDRIFSSHETASHGDSSEDYLIPGCHMPKHFILSESH